MKCDLHCHTRLSDGSLGLEELISTAKRMGIEVLSITDHDTMAGAMRAKVLGRRFDVKVIPGAEISCFDYTRNRKAHLLCYLCDKPDRLEGLFRRIQASRKKAALKMVKRIVSRYPISAEQIVKCATGSSNVFKQHIMHALMDAGFTTQIYGKLYDELFAPEKGIALVEPEYPDINEVLKAVHDAGGIAVLAHPTHYDSYDLMLELIQKGLDGIEVWHPRHNEFDVQRLYEVSRKYNLLMTGGSDFHGMYNRTVLPLASCTTPKENLEALLSYKEKQRKKTRANA